MPGERQRESLADARERIAAQARRVARGGEAPKTDRAGAVAQFADFADPAAAAATIVDAQYTVDGIRILHYWQGDFHLWTGSEYEVVPVADMREILYRIGMSCSLAPMKKRTVDDVLDALRAAANLSHRKVPVTPAWHPAAHGDPDPRAVIPLRNGVLSIDTGALNPPSPRLFAPYCLRFDYVVDAPQPVAWLAFLASIWPDDQESIDCLQEWLGYLLVADTSQQKALLIVGPRRSGKGTIGRVIASLLGARNVASPTLSSFGHQFGLQVLIGKTVALVSDARLGAKADVAAIAENMLRLTGEDEISIDRKFLPAYTARLLARLVVFANEVPTFRDAASALPSRFLILRMKQSFLGREDHALESRLVAELGAILAWSLAGLRRLRERGRFMQPKSAMQEIRLMEELASPIGAFLRERCILEHGSVVPVKSLYNDWRLWCEAHGREHAGTEQAFGRDLAAAAPSVRHFRPRVNGDRVRYYKGVRLRTPEDKHDDDDDLS